MTPYYPTCVEPINFYELKGLKGGMSGQGARFLYLCPLGMSIYLVLTNQWEPQLLRYPLHVSETSKAGGQALSAPHTEGAHPKEAPRF